MKILTCNSNRPLADAISAYLRTPLTNASVRRFSDMEVFVEIHENVRGEDVFIVQSTSYPANDNLMELLVTLDALKRASALRITAVIPYYGYAQPVLVQDIQDTFKANGDLTIVSPDVGGVVRARALARRLDADLAIIDK